MSEWTNHDPWWDDCDERVEAELVDGRTVIGKMQVDAHYDHEIEEERPHYCGIKLDDGTVVHSNFVRWRKL